MTPVTSHTGGRYLTPEWNKTYLRSRYCTLFEHKKMLNDCFGNKELTFQMPKNNLNFEVTPPPPPVNFDEA